ncbi:MAG: hypothetical protein UV80_C0002G0095 [Candidatus Peregrinibacteria bacterium GW2011_GWF2_43_17]|nr:MAG: hypothetical protein UV80_C0002G0095 [Candidatus Peregrinibacteria bacterium GW2011_GWF2_43_17]KKT18551.1 MAG: hypothetical protein UW03_C0038G0002 [Candidatus Peregrinibacteria bacterium GW2011_GWA2_43_8]HAU39860.1 hypothetical protein [Candidatus Peregrinibacteria bacterium]
MENCRHEWVESTEALCNDFSNIREQFGLEREDFQEWLARRAWEESQAFINGFRAFVCERCNAMEVLHQEDHRSLPPLPKTEEQQNAAWRQRWGNMPKKPPTNSSGDTGNIIIIGRPRVLWRRRDDENR